MMIPPDVLAEHHLKSLITESAIDPGLVIQRGYRTVEKQADLRRLGFSANQLLVPGLLFPIWGVTGEIAGYQMKPDSPRVKDGKPIKYETAARMLMALDIHPSFRHLLNDPAVPLWITEGIKKGDALASRGCCAVALLGVWNWRGTNDKGGKTALAAWENIALNQRRVYIVFDSDVMTKQAVHAALVRLQAFLAARGADVVFIYLPSGAGGVKVGADDFLASGKTVDDLVALATHELREIPATSAAENWIDDDKKSQATLLVEISSVADFFHDEHGDAYAAFDVDGHRETWPTRSNGFRRWLARLFYTTFGKSPSTSAISDALTVIEGNAQFDGDLRRVFTRIAAGDDGTIYLDLGTTEWNAVRVTSEAWEVTANPSVHFRRGPTTSSLPLPVRGGLVDELRAVVNVASDDDFRRVIAWLIGALRPSGPYPLLAFIAEQGCGKSLTARFLRSLVDPSAVPLRGMPREERDLVIAAKANHIVALDNVSSFSQWLSDALCRMATGAGWATRRLFTDSDEEVFSQSRPVLVTGIEDYVTNGDLLDRTMLVALPTIAPSKRRQETELIAEFEALQPRVLGALLDAVVVALRVLPTVRLPGLPRMADFAAWVIASEEALGWPEGAFLSAYMAGSNAAYDVILEASIIADPLRQLAADSGDPGWTGTATQLLGVLKGLTDEEARKNRAWPASGRGMSGLLRRLAPTLRAIGVDVEFGREMNASRRRTVTIREGGRRASEQGPDDLDGMDEEDRDLAAVQLQIGSSLPLTFSASNGGDSTEPTVQTVRTVQSDPAEVDELDGVDEEIPALAWEVKLP